MNKEKLEKENDAESVDEEEIDEDVGEEVKDEKEEGEEEEEDGEGKNEDDEHPENIGEEVDVEDEDSEPIDFNEENFADFSKKNYDKKQTLSKIASNKLEINPKPKTCNQSPKISPKRPPWGAAAGLRISPNKIAKSSPKRSCLNSPINKKKDDRSKPKTPIVIFTSPGKNKETHYNTVGSTNVITQAQVNKKIQNTTIFTLISDEIKRIRDHNPKDMTRDQVFDLLVNDNLLKRMIERATSKNKQVIEHFFERNKENEHLKKVRFEQLLLKLEEEGNVDKITCKHKARTPANFLNDQLKFCVERDMNVNKLREDLQVEKSKLIFQKPKINETSKKLVKEKQVKVDVYNRLFKAKLDVYKTHKINKDLEEQVLLKINPLMKFEKKDKKPVVKTTKEIINLSEKLHSDASAKVKKLEVKKHIQDKEFSELNKCSKSDEKSDVIILEKLAKDYFVYQIDTFHKKFNNMLTFQELKNMLLALGFATNERSAKPTTSFEISSNLYREDPLIKDFCKLLNNFGEKYNSDQIFLLLSGILKIYKGEENLKMNISLLSPNKSVISSKGNEADRISLKKFKYKKSNTEIRETKNPKIKTNERGNANENKSAHDIIKRVIPDLNIDAFQYSSKVIKTAASQFFSFYTNRTNHLTRQKCLKKKICSRDNSAGSIQSRSDSQKAIFSNKKKMDNGKEKAAENYRRKCYEKAGVNKDANVTVNEIYNISRKLHIDEMRKREDNKKKLDESQYSYVPKTNKHRRINSNSLYELGHSDVINNLYENGKSKIRIYKSLEKPDHDYERNKHELTFKPRLNGNVRSSMFDNNPLETDASFSRNIERLQGALLSKKLLSIQKERGYTDVNNPQSLKDYLKNEDKVWKFGIDRKWSKESMQRSISRNNSQSSTKMNRSNSNVNRSSQSQSKREDFQKRFLTPILQLSVNLDENIKKKIEIFQFDDPYQVADEFCRKYGLNEEKKIFLQKIIAQKLRGE